MRQRVGSIIVGWFLDVVEKWAEGYWVIRETGIATPGNRLDALLVPISQNAHCMKSLRGPFWKRPRIVGVEVKTSRNDFQRGLKTGQYEKYDEAVTGLYLVVPKGDQVCKMKEVPKNLGFIEVDNSRHRSAWTLACKRHPKYGNTEGLSAEIPWRLMFRLREEMNLAINDERHRYEERYKELRNEVDRTVHNSIRQIENQIIAREGGQSAVPEVQG